MAGITLRLFVFQVPASYVNSLVRSRPVTSTASSLGSLLESKRSPRPQRRSVPAVTSPRRCWHWCQCQCHTSPQMPVDPTRSQRMQRSRSIKAAPSPPKARGIRDAGRPGPPAGTLKVRVCQCACQWGCDRGGGGGGGEGRGGDRKSTRLNSSHRL